MYVKEAIQNILEKNLDEMKNNFQAALTEKAISQLEEKKIKIAQSYFGQMDEMKNPAREGSEAAKKDEESREKHMEKYGKLPARLTGELAAKFMKRKKN
jgi:regulator of replication initiation timing